MACRYPAKHAFDLMAFDGYQEALAPHAPWQAFYGPSRLATVIETIHGKVEISDHSVLNGSWCMCRLGESFNS